MRSKIIAVTDVTSRFPARFKPGVTRQETATQPATILSATRYGQFEKKDLTNWKQR